ncbi:MAG: four helix bundle protein [Flavobacteriales bacterium]
MTRRHQLRVYQEARNFNKEIGLWIIRAELPGYLRNQLGRAALSVMLNIAEGSTRFTGPDQRHFYIIARSSLNEVSAIIDYLEDVFPELQEQLESFDKSAESLSKQLFRLIEAQSKSK